MANIQLLLLAAGSSSRMGSSKQLLQWGKITLIEHQITTLLNTDHPLSVILGAYSEKIISLIDKFPIKIYKNDEWERGMGDSIAFGVRQLLNMDTTIDGILISLIDQPLITTAHFKKMLRLYQKGKDQIIVSRSEKKWSGAPVLFDKKYFNELQSLSGDKGAKAVISNHKHSIQYVKSINILQDMDTPESYNALLNKFKLKS